MFDLKLNFFVYFIFYLCDLGLKVFGFYRMFEWVDLLWFDYISSNVGSKIVNFWLKFRMNKVNIEIYW